MLKKKRFLKKKIINWRKREAMENKNSEFKMES